MSDSNENGRDLLAARLETDLHGPSKQDELLSARPSDVYLTGVLWPRTTAVPQEDDEKLAIGDADEPDGSDTGDDVRLSSQLRPSTAGLSFSAKSGEGRPRVTISIRCATYHAEESVEPSTEPTRQRSSKVVEDRDAPPTRRRRLGWRRRSYAIPLSDLPLPAQEERLALEQHGGPSGLYLHLRCSEWAEGVLATAVLVNMNEPTEEIDRNEREAMIFFQTSVEVLPGTGTILNGRPEYRSSLDEDDAAAQLLYRNARQFAVGHTCSAGWDAASGSNAASRVFTSWFPSVVVPAVSADGHEEFHRLAASGSDRPLSASWLASANSAAMAAALRRLPTAYESWIRGQRQLIDALPHKYKNQAGTHLDACDRARSRILESIALLENDETAATAFRLGNAAMALQRRWAQGEDSDLVWRPFQLGFVLLALRSTLDGHHPDRSTMDLLWFPTGGGKTEAYLALIAILLFYRRLHQVEGPDVGAGVAAIMRYTLRLLTTQQFKRAAAMVLACEAIRRGRAAVPCQFPGLGETAFSIGLWVGDGATPNTIENAIQALAGGSGDISTPRQLLECPCCRQRLIWTPSPDETSIHVRCATDPSACALGGDAPLPVWTVDDDIYRERPSLLIGTVDKFARIVFRKETSALFGLPDGRPPDLILQDELHLISGPLGTLTGLYEVAVDELCSRGGVRPKLIGSTATIRRASAQIEALFARKTVQFPAPGIDYDNSGFAVLDRRASGRRYVGVTTAGRSAKFTLQAVCASLLQSATAISDEARDPYWTLVAYFNSLRELGGALVLMHDDVNATLTDISGRRQERPRGLESIEELTSRLSQVEVRDMLDRLDVPVDKPEVLDAVLATNMLSVGVDIPRLGLMVVNGQPKGIAEYIQATSRVGRGRIAGLVVTVLNNAKARDRSHYESFASWHRTLYRDVEATSVTPFASRARDRALHAVLVALVRHLLPGLRDKPSLTDQSAPLLQRIMSAIQARAHIVDRDEETAVVRELRGRIADWISRAPSSYWNPFRPQTSLVVTAEYAAAQRAIGRSPGDAWPVPNSMRNVEITTRYQMVEALADDSEPANGQAGAADGE